MFRNYFKIALRQLKKHKMYSAIKIGGFSLGIAACLLIALYIRDEMSYDRSYPDPNRIFRVTLEYNNLGTTETGADWPAPMSGALREDFPEVENAGRLMPHELFYGAGSNELRRSDKMQDNYEDRFSFADQNILDILQPRMIYGDRKTALSAPNSMVITRRMAEKYFPGENPVGKTMILNEDKTKPYTVSGVMEDFPTNSHIQYDFLLTLTGHEFWPGEQLYWGASNYYTYIRVKPGSNIAALRDKLKLIITKYYMPMLRQAGDKTADSLEKNAKILLQPISDVHLKSYNIDDELHNGDIRFVRLFGAIACFILILACINFINLSTARSANRAREVGLRKVIGSYRIHLVKQFLTESTLFSLLSFFLGILLAWLLIPYFNFVAEKSLSIPWTSWWLLPILILAALVVGIIAGLYPSFYLSAFKPIEVIKGQLSRGSRNSRLRNVLVVFQFAISIMLIVGTIIIYGQMKFILHRKLGYDKDQVMLIQGANTLGKGSPAFKQELTTLSQVKSVSVCDFLPVSGTKRDGETFWKEGRTKEDIGISGQLWPVDHDYIRTMGMQILRGRDFSREMASDSDAIIINQAMAEKLALNGDSAIGKRITIGRSIYHIIGLMQDFNFESMRQGVNPLSLILGGSGSTIVSVKINTPDMASAIARVTSVWKRFSPNQPIRYVFMDERFASMYADIQRVGRLFGGFSILAIVIACLGLFALSAFMAEQRMKEISVRRVLGATVSQMVGLLSRNFLLLVGIAFLIASPLAWWVMHKWLQDFAYQIPITPWMFLGAGSLILVIALLTVSFQSVKAALTNPSRGLRSE
jgi:putative ABC transport system permease protein